MSQTPVYRLRGIDPELWQRFLARLTRDELRVSKFFDRIIRRYADGAEAIELPPTEGPKQ
jgi:hypothetical protein